MKRIKYFAALCVLGLTLTGCGADSDAPTTTQDLPIAADGTVDSEELRSRIRAATEATTSEIVESWTVDATTREPLNPDPEDVTITDTTDGVRHYSKMFILDSWMEGYIADGQEWTRYNLGEWELKGPYEKPEKVEHEYKKYEFRTINAEERRFEMERHFADEDESRLTEIVLDEEYHIIEQFVDRGDGEGTLQKARNINQPVEFPDDLPDS